MSRVVVVMAQGLALAGFSLLGLLLPRRKEGLFHLDTVINLATGVLLAGLKLLVLSWLIDLAVQTLGVGLIPLSAAPWWIQLPVAFLVLDWSRWLLHLIHHRVGFLWTFHRVHHSSERINATAGLRMHVVDFVQLALLPVLLFSVVFDMTASPAWLLPACLVPGVVLDAFEHANVRLDIRHPFWRVWDRVLNNPHFHAWHHTADGALRDGNYGNALTVWDRLFGTCVSSDDLPEQFGLDEASKLRNSWWALQLLRPHR